MHMHKNAGELRREINDLEVKRRELKILNEFAGSLMSIPTVEDLFWHVAQEVVARLGFVDCVIYKRDFEASVLRQVAASGNKNPDAQDITNIMTIPIGEGITGTVTATGQSALIGDLHMDTRYIEDLETARSEICVPLIVDEQVYGVIDCEDPRVDHFNDNHLEILTTVASLTSSKIVQCETLTGHIRLEEIISRVSEFIIIARTDGTILECNPVAESVIGDGQRSVKGQNLFSLYDNGTKERSHRIEALRALEAGKPWTDRITFRDGSGVERTFEFSATPLGSAENQEDGETGYQNSPHDQFVAIGRDVSKQVHAEEALKERNRVLQDMSFELRDALEQSNIAQRAQAAFLANVSHELRTPLNAIVGFSDIMTVTDLIQKNPDRALEYNGHIHSAGQHLASLVNDVLQITSLAADGTEVSRDDFSAKADLETCLALVDHKAAKKSIQINLGAVPADLHLGLNQRHFKQIITNLLDNAIKFSPEGSLITIDASLTTGQSLEISIGDQGRGIEASQLDSIFTAFSRADWALAQDVEGAGLGLALVNEMVEANGCEISVASIVDEGTTFTIHIPPTRIRFDV